MKEKVFGALMALIVLASTTGLWFCHKGKITFLTDLKPETEVLLQYQKKTDGNLISVKKKSKPDGKISFEVKGKTLSYFKVNVPENTVIKNIQFRGWKKQNIILNAQNEYTGKILRNRISITDWYNLIVLGGLGYYLGWFLIHSLKYGFPKDDPKLPKMLNIEFLRIVFTLIVVIHHLNNNFQELKIWNAGWLGVEFFFILSGFLLVLTFRPEKTAISFIKNRWIRFAPLVIFGGVLSSLFFDHVRAKYFVESIFFYSYDFDFIKWYYNKPVWYIYVLFWVGIFYFYLMKAFKKEIVNLLMSIITVSSLIYFMRYNVTTLGIFSGWIMRGSACMGLGYFLAEIYKNTENAVIVRKKTYNSFELFILLFSIFNVIFIKQLYMDLFVSCISFMILILLFSLRKGAISNFFEKPVFAKIARYCLSVYLTHWVVIRHIFPIYLEKYKEFFLTHTFVPFSLVLISVCLLGVVTHHAIELPATRALKKWLG